ncbi:hypothetical protein GS924_06770 [Rhodococcus hoagii]|nr:hypothetical protein [Prescottella equi]
MKPELQRALPKHMDPDRMARIALTVLRQTPKLNECKPESFLGALMTAAQVGLEPGPLGEPTSCRTVAKSRLCRDTGAS